MITWGQVALNRFTGAVPGFRVQGFRVLVWGWVGSCVCMSTCRQYVAYPLMFLVTGSSMISNPEPSNSKPKTLNIKTSNPKS